MKNKNKFSITKNHFKFNDFCTVGLKIDKITNVYTTLLRAFSLVQKAQQGSPMVCFGKAKV